MIPANSAELKFTFVFGMNMYRNVNKIQSSANGRIVRKNDMAGPTASISHNSCAALLTSLAKKTATALDTIKKTGHMSISEK